MHAYSRIMLIDSPEAVCESQFATQAAPYRQNFEVEGFEAID
jgi:hypothetical protein